MGTKSKTSAKSVQKKLIGMIDSRATDENTGLLIERDRKVTMLDIFGTEQKTAVAYYVSDLLAKGYNNNQIREEIKLKYDLSWSLRQVNVVKELLHKMWRCDIAHTMNDQIAREVATIDLQLKETWTAWEKSKKNKRTTKHRAHQTSDAEEMSYDLDETTDSIDDTAGDVKFLQHLNELGKEKRKLLGLYAPEKKEAGPAGGGNAIQFNIVGEGASENAANLMSAIMNMRTPTSDAPEKKQEVQEAEVVEEEYDYEQMMLDME